MSGRSDRETRLPKRWPTRHQETQVSSPWQTQQKLSKPIEPGVKPTDLYTMDRASIVGIELA